MNQKGFTLLEILMAIAIATIVITIVVFSFSKLNSSQALERTGDLIASVLDEARSLTLSGSEDSQYGVHFEDDQIVLFKGTSYSSGSEDNVVTDLNDFVEIGDIELSGGGDDIIFKRLTGYTDEAGTIEVFVTATPENNLTITISETGLSDIDS